MSPIDLRLRLVAAALEPGLTLARLSSLPLDDVQAMVATGYFNQWKMRGMSLRGIARRIGKSLRTTATLSRKASQHATLGYGGERMTWRRKLATHVAKHGEVSRARLIASIRGVKRSDIDTEVARLVEDGIFAETDGTVALATQYISLLGEDVERRLDSLRHFLDAVTQAIYQRFIASNSDAVGLARVLSFRADRKELERMCNQQYESLRQEVLACDRTAGDNAVEAALALCITESPTGLPWTTRPGD